MKMKVIRAIGILSLAGLAAGYAVTPAMAQSRDQVCFYADAGFHGRQLCLRSGQSRANLAGSFNDTISSVRVPSGMQARACADANFHGRCMTFDRSVSDFNSIRFNDVVSSVAAQPAGRGQAGRQQPQRGPVFMPGFNAGRDAGGGGYGPDQRMHRDYRGGDNDRESYRDTRRHMYRLRDRCRDGDLRACVQFGIMIGQQGGDGDRWRESSPDLFYH